jgi:hypothetical protein
VPARRSDWQVVLHDADVELTMLAVHDWSGSAGPRVDHPW